ncbi:DUF2231 domain-containing protein [Synechococcus sp. BA-124 BA4]|jgi:uncharacterized membrane protein|uniref:DUF2231 domain-containing protein n=1 Tax=unclassified Synechococcus TaxID=2626047 RepID=UPI0018CF3083|nr:MULTISPECIES: DUF2231 domain-containing protein [unclassified Synechococcus]MEA5401142.1 DUF2231 domain-containing protein [Synechococcus sp. BA-124 BA4]QPN56081.1 DUF2231 domain-containing protein [Synechococcus sp. CBW1107]CAK6699460.1 hypothetical protein BBFGKLBO_02661 [Synechococcus sp. CBW1107]
MELGANDLPYRLPIHPNLVHLTIGLFVIAIAFDIAGALFPFEKRLFRFLALPVTRAGLHDVGWYNLLACCLISFFTVAAGFVEMQLADPLPGVTSSFGMGSTATMLWHGAVGVGLLFSIVLMTLWRGVQRYRWRWEMGRQVQWSYLLVGLLVFALMAWHGTLGAQLGVEFGVHVTASQLLGEGASLREALP